MATHRTRLRDSRAWRFDLSLCVLGLALLAWCLPPAWEGGWHVGLAILLGVPLVVVVARFPMVLDSEDGGIEIGFDSSVLMFLLCTFDPRVALAVWGLAVVATQLVSGKRPSAKVFNIGVGILAGPPPPECCNRARSWGRDPTRARRGGRCGGRYFFVDYVVSAISIAIDSGTPGERHLVHTGTLLAVACFVPFDMLGYLAAIVYRSNPWWTLSCS